MLAQNLFMENCYRLQKDEPQLETKISEVLNEMINTFKAKLVPTYFFDKTIFFWYFFFKELL